MNKQQRKEIEGIVGLISPYADSNVLSEMDEAGRGVTTNVIDDARSEIESIKADEEEKLENMPESLRDGSKGEQQQEVIDNLDSAVGALEDAVAADHDEEWATTVAEKVAEAVDSLNSV